jgi:glyoxylase-like metal-dependent hydrolase (beta-lactamase superfamily II)
MTRIVYTSHARDQMASRRIASSQVERALAAPTRLYPGHGGRLAAERVTTIGNTLRVVDAERVTATETVLTVITVIRIRM